MKKVLVLVEGQTEERFVKEVLCPQCLNSEVFLQPVVLATKRTKMGRKYRGGVSTYGKIRNDIVKLLGDTSAAAVTTLLDYYKLPGDFPGQSDRKPGDCYGKVDHLEECFATDIGDQRFMPFLMLHEFETMLFSDIEKTAEAFHFKKGCLNKLEMILKDFRNIEEINDGEATHPSMRITNIFTDYQKAMHGPMITGRIGIDKIRESCRHFDSWITRVENISV